MCHNKHNIKLSFSYTKVDVYVYELKYECEREAEREGVRYRKNLQKRE